MHLLPFIVLISSAVVVQSQRNIIYLNDNTEKDVTVGSVLGDALGGPEPVSYALLQSDVSSYFRVDGVTGQLSTKQRVDRDRLCIDSVLCCAGKVSGSQTISMLSQLITSPRGRQDGSVCSLRLDVAATAGHEHGLPPNTYSISIEIRDENDHAPVFAVSVFSLTIFVIDAYFQFV